MALSKPTNVAYNLIGSYFNRLYTDPVKTRVLTSCLTAILGNIISQRLARIKNMNTDSLFAFALFGLCFGGTLPYYFNRNIRHFSKNSLFILLAERALFMPLFQALYLYMLPIFEGKTHEEACEQVKHLYRPLLSTNLKYITLLQYINTKFVPPMLRIFVANFIDLLWTIYVANQRARCFKKTCGKKCSKCD